MKKVVLLSSILMMAGAMNAWAVECAEGAAGKYGAITIATDGDKCVATLDPNDTTSVNIPDDVTIDQFVYDRNFKAENTGTGNAVFTVCFPFSSVGVNGGFGGNLYKIAAIQNNGSSETPQWQIIAQENVNDTMKAGIPYFIQNTWSDNLTLIPVSPINTSTLSPVTFGEEDEWEFRGTYNYKKWESGSSDIGRVYGFVARDTTTDSGVFKAGQFVRGKAGAFIKPMRAYLYYTKKASSTPDAKGMLAKTTANVEDLPQTIEVVFKDADGNPLSIGRLNPTTGVVTPVEGWFDMKGRKLNQKPTLPGTYFNNGEKVIIK